MRRSSFALLFGPLLLTACPADDTGATGSDTTDDEVGESGSSETDTGEGETDTGEPPELDAYGFAGGCYSLRSGDTWLTAAGESYEFSADANAAAAFHMKASDLGTYLLYDQDGGYLVSDSGPLLRQTSLQSDILLVDDSYVSGAEWMPETSLVDWDQYQLRNRRNDLLLAAEGLAETGAAITFDPAEGCTEHPELSLDATGSVAKTTFDDGILYGIVDTHSHVFSNAGFGGGGIFHGAPYHRLGVEHALMSCEQFHGEMGRQDFFGYAFDSAGANDADLSALIPDLVAGELSFDNHNTDGYPTFSDWPNGPSSSTHQTQYYRWLERAYLAGLRLEVLHATTNSAICHFMVGEELQPTRYDCEDMTAVDRIIDESYALERYIDAQAGGPGEGWFRIVQTPAEAREIIASGKLAVVLGIETSDLFGCKITPRNGSPTCDEAYIKEQLDYYYALGVRAIFPVHKYDNAFSPGDGNRAFIELGNFLNSGYSSNFTEDCPPEITDGFDKGDVFFGGINDPRDEFIGTPDYDFSGFPDAPVNTTSLFLAQLLEPALEGDYCQNATMTPMGEMLMGELMQRGMIIEVDHLPQWAYKRAFELLEAANYPAAGTHGRNFEGLLYELGGISKTGLSRCHDPENPGGTGQSYQNKIAFIEAHGGYPAEGFGFDLNGFAGARGPRFGDGLCDTTQEDPVTYPFSSYAGDVEFSQPVIGERELDFNTEGLVHIGLLPELIEDARRDSEDGDLDPLFRSAEGYIRMWELAETRAAEFGD
ncbi:membrane dipeptidase [Pseudenhygromyxa sp. WMMC2535]|uniref:membrane dipeptidase n=1 Tax=Pseudenhygromyxa sp. WMMC2535 TaxID=2712867 RepID=UPI00155209D5|nr:membrane dipeptidase [Pseudenhygromyxa sp. WMMC2535]NVB43153.1 membrane dipeptidase [Pseudenhygromyxa sp. WMMC2535]